ncbi:nitrate reductase subunit beta, partial [Bacillus subtilis]
PTAHREYAENAFDLKGSCGFTFGDGCSNGVSQTSLFGAPPRDRAEQPVTFMEVQRSR